MARKRSGKKAPVDQETIDQCLAKAMADGDFVNFRFLFGPSSPLREDSCEDISTAKYSYLVPGPEEQANPHFKRACGTVATVEMHGFVAGEFEKKGPAQLPAGMVLELADNAVRLGKYTTAAQAYELLRIRRRMQEEFYVQADAALDEGNIEKGVRGYLIATGLEYDYAAFPEPLPAVPNHQRRALMLHAEYPSRPEDCVAFQDSESHLRSAFEYLLLNPEAASRLDNRSKEQRLAFAGELVRQMDPDWESFTRRYREAHEVVCRFSQRIERAAAGADQESGLQAEIDAQDADTDLAGIPALLLGRTIEHGEWWQYLKELAYEHPAAALFIGRQALSKDIEIIMPRFRDDAEQVRVLGLIGG